MSELELDKIEQFATHDYFGSAAVASTDVRALLAAHRTLVAERDRLRAAAMWTVDKADFWVATCCDEAVNQPSQWCENYGCGTLLELVEHLRAALAGQEER